jgi:membrane-bound lytic murein transglycosylase A
MGKAAGPAVAVPELRWCLVAALAVAGCQGLSPPPLHVPPVPPVPAQPAATDAPHATAHAAPPNLPPEPPVATPRPGEPGPGNGAVTPRPSPLPANPLAATTGQVRYEREPGAAPLAIADADWLAAWPAWLASCRALTAERNPRHGVWDDVCTESIFLAPSRGAEVRRFFSQRMDCYRLVAIESSAAATSDTGLMTGYYEPVLEGSRRRTAVFGVALYRAPAQSITTSRAELASSGQLQGQELLWVQDPVEAFFLEVQGSGRIHLADGSWVRVAYAGSNGLAYRSIGRWLVDQGELPLGQVSQQAIRAWAAAHPKRVRELLEQNPRVVFFREMALGNPDAGPVGSLGVALTPGVSVAVDPRFVPLGAPLLLDTRAPVGDAALTRLALAQDTGGAIRGPLRVDWFWGLGPAAGELAGHQHAPGTVRLLVPRGVAPEALL